LRDPARFHPWMRCIQDAIASGSEVHPKPGSRAIRAPTRSDPNCAGSLWIPRIQNQLGSLASRIGFAPDRDRAGSGSGGAWIGLPDRVRAEAGSGGIPDRVHPKSGSGPSGSGASKIWIGAVGSGAIHSLDRAIRIGRDPRPDRVRSWIGIGGAPDRVGWGAIQARGGVQAKNAWALAGFGSGSLHSGWARIGMGSKGIQPGSGSDRDRYFLDGVGSGRDPRGSSPDRDRIGIATFWMAWIGWDPDRGILDRARSRIATFWMAWIGVGSGSGNPGSGAIPDR